MSAIGVPSMIMRVGRPVTRSNSCSETTSALPPNDAVRETWLPSTSYR